MVNKKANEVFTGAADSLFDEPSEEELSDWEGGTSPPTKVERLPATPVDPGKILGFAKNLAGATNEMRNLIQQSLPLVKDEQLHTVFEGLLKLITTVKFVGYDLYRSINESKRGAEELWVNEQKMAAIVLELKKIANELDERGFTKEADAADEIMRSLVS